MKCFRPIRSLVTLKFPAIDNIFHIFFLLPEIKGGGEGPGPMIFNKGLKLSSVTQFQTATHENCAAIYSLRETPNPLNTQYI